jgi:UPF0755 protein
MKKLFIAALLIGTLVALFLGWRFFGPTTSFKSESKSIYINTGQNNLDNLIQLLKEDSVIHNENLFRYAVGKMKAENKIQPGKFIIKKGASLFDIVQKFRNNDQEIINLVITKLRTKQDFAKLVSRKFECDSMRMMDYLNDEKALTEFEVNPETVFTTVLPNTYSFKWATTPKIIFSSLHRESQKFWNDERKQKAAALGLTEKEVYIIASIVEEETNAISDKQNIASVYINRLKMGMPLQADPTVKFAMQDFGIRRILNVHLLTNSPYNTYRNKGLPPGPICTPSLNTLNEVLNSKKTDYLYFVANSDFSGTHIFTTNYQDHLKYAREFQRELTIYLKNKQNNP